MLAIRCSLNQLRTASLIAFLSGFIDFVDDEIAKFWPAYLNISGRNSMKTQLEILTRLKLNWIILVFRFLSWSKMHRRTFNSASLASSSSHRWFEFKKLIEIRSWWKKITSSAKSSWSMPYLQVLPSDLLFYNDPIFRLQSNYGSYCELSEQFLAKILWNL